MSDAFASMQRHGGRRATARVALVEPMIIGKHREGRGRPQGSHRDCPTLLQACSGTEGGGRPQGSPPRIHTAPALTMTTMGLCGCCRIFFDYFNRFEMNYDV